jgi:hypothetical protein
LKNLRQDGSVRDGWLRIEFYDLFWFVFYWVISV